MCQIKANLPVLTVQSGGELRDETVGPSPGLFTMPPRVPSHDESVPSIFANGFLRASDVLWVYYTGDLLTELKDLLPFLCQ